MRQYGEDFYSIVRGTLDDITLQDFVDSVEANRYNVLDIPGFVMGDIQDENTFKQLIREISIVPMAIGTDYDSPPLPFAEKGFELQSGNIPRHKTRREFNEQDVRKMRRAMKLASGSRSATAAAEELLSTIQKHITSHNNRMSYIRHQMMSTNMYEMTIQNNNYGIVGHKFTAGVPGKNIVTKTTTSRWWTDAALTAEGSASDPIADLKEMIDSAEYDRGLRNMVMEIDRSTAKKLVNHSKVVSAIAAATYPNAGSEPWATSAISGLTWENRLQRLSELVGAPFEIVDHVSAIEQYNPATGKFEYPQMNSFNPYVVVLRPAGIVGEIISQEPLRISPESVHYADFWGGRGLITVDWDVLRRVEYMETEETALPLFSMPQNIFILQFYGTGVQGASLNVGGFGSPASINIDSSESSGNKRGRKPKDETETVNVESEE